MVISKNLLVKLKNAKYKASCRKVKKPHTDEAEMNAQIRRTGFKSKMQANWKKYFSEELIEPCDCSDLKYHQVCIRERIVRG